jgi:hypothetical protein
MEGGEEGLSRYSAKPEEVEQLKADLRFEYPNSLYDLEGRGIDHFARDAEDSIVERYGQYIPKEELEERKGNEGRIIVGKLEDFHHTFWGAWHGQKDSRESTPPAFMTHTGRILFMNHPDYYWETQFSDTEKRRLIEELGSEEKAKDIVGFETFLNIASHEIVHTFESKDLPLWFIECGASYYSDELINELEVGKIEEPIDRARKEKYARVLDKYGEDVHKVFYNQLEDEDLENKILAEMTDEEFAELFPEEYKDMQNQTSEISSSDAEHGKAS